MRHNNLHAIVEKVDHEVEHGLGAPLRSLAAFHGDEQHLVRDLQRVRFLVRRTLSVIIDTHIIVNAHAQNFINAGWGTQRQPHRR
ncbi:hypothetical protein D3C77_297340 [compost metagenome]